MRCPNCGQNTPDGIPNCINCGKVLNSVDYQQMYYKNKIEREQKIHNNLNSFGRNINNNLNKMENSVQKGFYDVEKSISNGINDVSNAFMNSPQSGTYKAMDKKGDDAFIMGLVAMILSFFGGTIISLVLGIIALNWGKKAYAVTNKENHKNAKIFGLVATIISSLYILTAVIVFIIQVALAAGSYYYMFDSFSILIKLIGIS